MQSIDEYLPQRINTGSFLTAYSLPALEKCVSEQRIVLPICSLGTPVAVLADLAPLVLPPLYHEALDEELKGQLLDRIRQCFPYYEGTQKRAAYSGQFEIVELPQAIFKPEVCSPRVIAFSVDTAVEEHGPHLPLMTDTIQSYGVLRQLAREFDDFCVGPPVEYGHLTWGLPFGLSIDITAPLLTRYVANFIDALLHWLSPQALYVVDVHGSIVHRTAIQQGIAQSSCQLHSFRWLHDPLVEFSGQRGDQHAGGVETALVEQTNAELVDKHWWPERVEEISAGQMSMQEAIDLSSDLGRFVERVERHPYNGVVGDINNYFQVDSEIMTRRMLEVARQDVRHLISST